LRVGCAHYHKAILLDFLSDIDIEKCTKRRQQQLEQGVIPQPRGGARAELLHHRTAHGAQDADLIHGRRPDRRN
jgi:hypothetical protein